MNKKEIPRPNFINKYEEVCIGWLKDKDIQLDSPPPSQLVFLEKKSPQRTIFYTGKTHPTRDGFYYPNVSLNIFLKRALPIPRGAKRRPQPSLKYIKKFVSNPLRKLIRPLARKPLHYEDAWIYAIHDNGGRPFLVYVNDRKDVVIYKIDEKVILPEIWFKEEDVDNWPFYTEKVREWKRVQRIFVGDDADCSLECPNVKGSFCLGNSILLEISPQCYVFIGEWIYSFMSSEPITKYHSPLFNNDVPMPVAESKTKYFFMVDHLWMKKKDFKKSEESRGDLYYDFYGHGGVTQNKNKQIPFDRYQVIQDRIV
jgi:hypothetical protein